MLATDGFFCQFTAVDLNETNVGRDIAGFLTGGVIASVAAGLVFVTFFPLPKEPARHDHTGEALMITVLVMFFCGGFIGRRGFSADAFSDLLPSVTGSSITVVVLCFLSGLSLEEYIPLIGFATVGIIASAASSFALAKWFPKAD